MMLLTPDWIEQRDFKSYRLGVWRKKLNSAEVLRQGVCQVRRQRLLRKSSRFTYDQSYTNCSSDKVRTGWFGKHDLRWR
jgi:hypothetical protein